jgi:hypothetical protein
VLKQHSPCLRKNQIFNTTWSNNQESSIRQGEPLISSRLKLADARLSIFSPTRCACTLLDLVMKVGSWEGQGWIWVNISTQHKNYSTIMRVGTATTSHYFKVRRMHLVILHPDNAWYLSMKCMMYFSGNVPSLAYFSGKVPTVVHSNEEAWDTRDRVALNGGMHPLLVRSVSKSTFLVYLSAMTLSCGYV